MLLSGFNGIFGLITLAMLVFAVVAFIFSATTREDAYRAAGKKTKKFWMIMLGAVVAVDALLPTVLFLSIAGLVATIVFMVDVRPAVRQISRGGRGGSSSDGPYGPYNGGR